MWYLLSLFGRFMKFKGIIYVLLAALIYGLTPLLCSLTYPLGNNGFSMTFLETFLLYQFCI